MLVSAKKPLGAFDEDDFRKWIPFLTGVRDPFTLTVGEVFLSYHQRRLRNLQVEWMASRGLDVGTAPLSAEEFVQAHGEPPWELLDETLRIVGLNYCFVPPKGLEEDIEYTPALTELSTGVTVTTSQLSSGEKTLLMIALSLYAGTRLGDAVELPKVLLLDEADASLHPSMVRSLLSVADEIFRARYGVKVILTTHSPTTVALAPESSRYTMSREGSPRLRPASRDSAVRTLMVGVPTLSIKNEHRRQVFVESKHDEACYQALFTLLSPALASPFSLEFIAAGHSSDGGEVAVRRLVTELREKGILSVFGLVDRDDRSSAPEGVQFLTSRRSVENLILDPLLVGFYLLRQHLLAPEDALLPAGLRHTELAAAQAQLLVDYVCARVGSDGGDETTKPVAYSGGFEIGVPSWCLDGDGHVLEERILAAFPGLRRHRDLKMAIIEFAWSEAPGFIPLAAQELLGGLLDAAA